MKVFDCFAGIGGFSLGLERSGMDTVAFCEMEPYARAVLRKHWPKKHIYRDITKVKGEEVIKRHGKIDLICGGPPCQDISVANDRGKGLDGKRSGLWFEYKRVIEEIRPRWVLVENVAFMRTRGLARIIKDLWEIGYVGGEWHIIPACAVGGLHRRERIFIIAHSLCERRMEQKELNKETELLNVNGQRGSDQINSITPKLIHGGPILRREDIKKCKTFRTESRVARITNGIPCGAYRNRTLGNAIVPQIPQIIGKRILEIEGNL